MNYAQDVSKLLDTIADLRFDARAATKLIEEQRAAIAELREALQTLVDFDDGDHPALWPFQHAFDTARELIAKHAPAQSPEATTADPNEDFVWHKDADPSPWCPSCGAMTQARCMCGPTDPMD